MYLKKTEDLIKPSANSEGSKKRHYQYLEHANVGRCHSSHWLITEASANRIDCQLTIASVSFNRNLTWLQLAVTSIRLVLWFWLQSRKRDHCSCLHCGRNGYNRTKVSTYIRDWARMYRWQFPWFGAGQTLFMPVCWCTERMRNLFAIYD